jgi:hypothetical protein
VSAISLRSWSESDADWYAAATRDPLIQRFTTESPNLTPDEVRAAIRALLASDHPYAGLVITDSVTGERPGNIAVSSEGEVSYWLAGARARQGRCHDRPAMFLGLGAGGD